MIQSKVPETRQLSKLEPEVEFRRQRTGFEFRFGGISLSSIKIFFTKFGVYVGNGFSQGTKWSKWVIFENPIRQTAAMRHTYNIPAFGGISLPPIKIFSRSLVGKQVNKSIFNEYRKQKSHNAPWSVTTQTELFSVINNP